MWVTMNTFMHRNTNNVADLIFGNCEYPECLPYKSGRRQEYNFGEDISSLMTNINVLLICSRAARFGENVIL